MTLSMFVSFCGCHKLDSYKKDDNKAPKIYLYPMLQSEKSVVKDWESLKGKVVVLEFWATWCHACDKSFNHMNKLAEGLEDKPVQFISITNEETHKIEEYIKTNPIKGWIGIDEDNFTKRNFKITAIPQIVVIDKEGKIAAKTFPTELQIDNIRALLN